MQDNSNTPSPLNTPPSTPRRGTQKQRTHRRTPAPWPRFPKVVPTSKIIEGVNTLCGYLPHQWQVDTAERILEGFDVAVVAGTGAGKSLIFAMLAIAAEWAEHDGLVVVITPLKALESDQVRRMNELGAQPNAKIRVHAVAINEDNHDRAVILLRSCSPEFGGLFFVVVFKVLSALLSDLRILGNVKCEEKVVERVPVVVRNALENSRDLIDTD